jgi:hypothetical protein
LPQEKWVLGSLVLTATYAFGEAPTLASGQEVSADVQAALKEHDMTSDTEPSGLFCDSAP